MRSTRIRPAGEQRTTWMGHSFRPNARTKRPRSGWHGTDAGHPLRYTPRRAAVAPPPYAICLASARTQALLRPIAPGRVSTSFAPLGRVLFWEHFLWVFRGICGLRSGLGLCLTCVFKAFQGRKNDSSFGPRKSGADGMCRQGQAGHSSRADLAIPCRTTLRAAPARRTMLRMLPGPTPFHQAKPSC